MEDDRIWRHQSRITPEEKKNDLNYSCRPWLVQTSKCPWVSFNVIKLSNSKLVITGYNVQMSIFYLLDLYELQLSTEICAY